MFVKLVKGAKIWRHKTNDALKMLTQSTLGEARHIIVHTGTNDLRAQQERVTESVT